MLTAGNKQIGHVSAFERLITWKVLVLNARGKIILSLLEFFFPLEKGNKQKVIQDRQCQGVLGTLREW